MRRAMKETPKSPCKMNRRPFCKAEGVWRLSHTQKQRAAARWKGPGESDGPADGQEAARPLPCRRGKSALRVSAPRQNPRPEGAARLHKGWAGTLYKITDFSGLTEFWKEGIDKTVYKA